MRTRRRLVVLSSTAVLIVLGAAAWLRATQQPAEQTIPDKVQLFIPYKDYPQADNQRILCAFGGLCPDGWVCEPSNLMPYNICRTP